MYMNVYNVYKIQKKYYFTKMIFTLKKNEKLFPISYTIYYFIYTNIHYIMYIKYNKVFEYIQVSNSCLCNRVY